MKLIKSQTYQNLARAFAGECMARTRYEFIEYGARNEGYKNIAEIIDGIAYQEFNHARMFYTYLQEASKEPIDNILVEAGYPFRQKWNVLDNLLFAAEDEQGEANQIYPTFARIAAEEGFGEIEALFRNVADVEKAHHRIFTDLAKQMKQDSLYAKKSVVLWKCNDCGYTLEARRAFTKCPLCKAEQGSILLQLDGGVPKKEVGKKPAAAVAKKTQKSASHAYSQ